MTKVKFRIEWYCDGWAVYDTLDKDRVARWDHNDDDMGTEGIKKLIEYLGHEAEVEEVY